jgi:hypothetical protein
MRKSFVLEIALLILRTRGGILGVYMALWLIYKGLGKLCIAVRELARQVHLKLPEEDRAQVEQKLLENEDEPQPEDKECKTCTKTRSKKT